MSSFSINVLRLLIYGIQFPFILWAKLRIHTLHSIEKYKLGNMKQPADSEERMNLFHVIEQLFLNFNLKQDKWGRKIGWVQIILQSFSECHSLPAFPNINRH